jgi:ACS family hexuronate transporter-like MFS transporter
MTLPHTTHVGKVAGNHGFPGLRWWIISLIFLITCINYIDRSLIGLLVTRFGPDLHITTRQYGFVSSLLLLAYTISQSVSGRLYDRFGARIGFSVSVVVWCVAAMAHAFITGIVSFAVCSFFLGLGEAGNWPGAAKVIAEWFPQRSGPSVWQSSMAARRWAVSSLSRWSPAFSNPTLAGARRS